MPVYEYACGPCNKGPEEPEVRFSQLRSISRYEDTGTCPECDTEAPRVLSTGTSFVLKGNGWAADGYCG